MNSRHYYEHKGNQLNVIIFDSTFERDFHPTLLFSKLVARGENVRRSMQTKIHLLLHL